MKLSEVLVKPIVSEKANAQQEKMRRYAFRVARKANKLEIKKAVEEFYGVTVIDVNTSVLCPSLTSALDCTFIVVDGLTPDGKAGRNSRFPVARR